MRRRTFQWGVGLGVAAVVLLMAGPLILANVGLPDPGQSAPVATLVTAGYSALMTVLPLFSAVLIGAALVMRHAEAPVGEAPVSEAPTD
ncbi:hypothetical protein FDK12_01435 [Arthrobacter sp. NamB2]|uniref:hypothetical protein n=1 Tax=Arthrobacter sp. NamB2 TaxID=2576035 RepID=UPI0010C9F487|nr:hypothetical protein [Arthrobacter sp. NamB2]TKV29621.1 hypothetical protein FDK12_01435 [Arthrobacter sp. NamB2]